MNKIKYIHIDVHTYAYMFEKTFYANLLRHACCRVRLSKPQVSLLSKQVQCLYADRTACTALVQ